LELSEIPQAVANAQKDVAVQQDYIKRLTLMLETTNTIQVMAGGIWSEVSLPKFIELQNECLNSFIEKAKALVELEQQLQDVLETALSQAGAA